MSATLSERIITEKESAALSEGIMQEKESAAFYKATLHIAICPQMKNFEINIARRLTLGNGRGKSSPAVKVAEISVALSIAVMIIAIGVVFGFKREITRKATGMNPQISLYPYLPDSEGRSVIHTDGRLGEILDSLQYVADWEPAVNTLALLKTPDSFKGLYLNGLPSTYDTSFLEENLTSGRLPDFKNPRKNSRSLLISQKVADELSLAAGDSVNIYGIGNSLSLQRMEVTGIYTTHMDMFDDVIAFSPLSAAADLIGFKEGEATAINVKTTDMKDVPAVSEALQNEMNLFTSENHNNVDTPEKIMVTNILDQCKGIFGWLGMLDTNVWVILVLLTLVSAFTLISGMLIIILEKVRFIGVMKALGASSASIRHIFVWIAMRIGVRGMIAGTIIGLGVLAVQYFFHIIKLNPEAYYMDYAPVDFTWWAFAAVEVGFAIIIYLVLVLPSRLVSRISPAESMRFE